MCRGGAGICDGIQCGNAVWEFVSCAQRLWVAHRSRSTAARSIPDMSVPTWRVVESVSEYPCKTVEALEHVVSGDVSHRHSSPLTNS